MNPPLGRFSDRVAFVSGGGHGIGAATVRRLCAEGARCVVADIDLDAATAVSRALPEATIPVRCDVTDSASVTSALAAVVERFGRLDLLVNVSGGSGGDSILGTDPDAWHRSLDLNLVGAMRLIRAAVPWFRVSEQIGASRGAIVLISSVNGLSAFGDEAYSAAKAGLSLVAKNLAVELGPEQIRANVVAPGTVRTRVWDDQGGADRLAGMYPLGRVGEPEDIAAAIAFLASDDAAWITGVTLPVDGGVTATGRTFPTD